MQSFTKQIENASAEYKNVMILGDANLCSLRWDSPNFRYKKISEELRQSVAQCGMFQMDLGVTYTADRLEELGKEITSAIDHLYVSKELKDGPVFSKLDNSLTDHAPILARKKKETQQARKPIRNKK